MDKNLLRKLAGIETKTPQQVSESSFNRIRELAGLSALPVKENKDKEEDLDMPADDKEEMPADEVVDNNEMPAGEEGEDELPEIIKDLAAQAAGKSDEELEDLMIQIYQAGVKDGEEKQEKVTEMYYYDDPSTMSPEQRREYHRRKNRSRDTLGNRPAGAIARHGDELKGMLQRPESKDRYQKDFTAKFSGPKGKLPEDVELEEGQKAINRQIKSLGSEKLIDTPNFKVVELKTKEAAQLYAAGTKWNIAAKTDKANTFDQYHAEGPIYVIIAKLDGQMKKFAFHPASRTFVDENDEKLSKATANKLTEFPEYQDFWKKLATRWHTANSTPYRI